MSILTHTVKFNNPVIFTDHTGVKFVNTTTAETASLVTSATVSPNNVLVYSVTWAVDPVAGDVVEWGYDGTGNYKIAYEAARLGATGTSNCTVITAGVIEVTYKDQVSWADQTGIAFFNVTTGETSGQPTGTQEVTPSTVVTYTGVSWINEPIAGDIIQLVISEPNTYRDVSFMDAQTLDLINCLSQPSLGTLIEDFENIADWADPATGGTFIANTSEFKTGTQSLQIGSPDTTIRKRYKYYAGGVDWSEGEYFDLWLNIPSNSGGLWNATLFFGFTTDAPGNLGGATSITIGGVNTGTFREGIVHIRFTKSQVSGSTVWSTIYNFQINLTPTDGAQELGFDAFYTNKRSIEKPKVMFTLDDGSLNQYEAWRDFFDPRDVQVSLFCNGSVIDTTGTTTANLQFMETRGSEICNHTFDHTDLTTLGTQAEMQTAVRTQTDWMKARSFVNWDIFAYPNGNLNAITDAAIKAEGMILGRSLRGANGGISVIPIEVDNIGIANIFKLNAINLNQDTTLQQALDAVDLSTEFGCTLMFYGHKFGAVADGETWATADLIVLLDRVNLLHGRSLNKALISSLVR